MDALTYRSSTALDVCGDINTTPYDALSPWYVTKPTRSTQPCIPLGSLNRVPALIGWGKGGNVTSAGWRVTLCDPIWHVSSRSGEACCELLYPVTYLLTLEWCYLFNIRSMQHVGDVSHQCRFSVGNKPLGVRTAVSVRQDGQNRVGKLATHRAPKFSVLHDKTL